MTYQERIKVLRELKEQPLQTLDKKTEQVEEALNWAIKICHKFVSKREGIANEH
jgi:hypothetical protein